MEYVMATISYIISVVIISTFCILIYSDAIMHEVAVFGKTELQGEVYECVKVEQ